MKLTQTARRTLIVLFFAAVAVAYGFAWSAPAIGLHYDDAVNLVTAKALLAGRGYTLDSLPSPVPQTQIPPVFPLLLTLFAAVSHQAQWLKTLPLLCAGAWLAATYKLLRGMGAEHYGALLLTAMTAACPAVVFLSTSLLPDALFAFLVAAALLAFLQDRMLLAGALAGFATLTCTVGLALIAGCALVLAVRGRFRSATLFTAMAILLVAPWFGWFIAHTPPAAASGILSLPVSEKATVIGTNAMLLLSGPFSLLSGIEDTYAAAFTLVLLAVCLWKRRQMLPDLFLLLYCGLLLFRITPPQRLLVPVLPLILWLFWRVFRNFRRREAVAAVVLIFAILPVWASLRRVPPTLRNGDFPPSAKATDNWNEESKLFRWMRLNTPPDAIIAASQDPLFYLQTGRKAVRGYEQNGYRTYYRANGRAVTPDELSTALLQNGVTYVAVTASPDAAESAAFRKSVEALERGGVLEPVEIPGLARQYRLLRTAQGHIR